MCKRQYVLVFIFGLSESLSYSFLLLQLFISFPIYFDTSVTFHSLIQCFVG